MKYDVVVAAKGDCKFIYECLSSILNQSLAPTSVRVILDMNDGHQEALQHLVTRHFPTYEVCTSSGHGMIKAINYGISAGNSDFISFLDSDDLWASEKQEQQVAALIHNPEVDVVTSDAMNVDSDGISDQRSEWTASTLFTSATFRRTAFQKFGLVDESATHFTWLYRWWANANRRGISRMHLTSPGVRRRVHGANSWVLQSTRAHEDLFFELRRIIGDQNRE